MHSAIAPLPTPGLIAPPLAISHAGSKPSIIRFTGLPAAPTPPLGAVALSPAGVRGGATGEFGK